MKNGGIIYGKINIGVVASVKKKIRKWEILDETMCVVRSVTYEYIRMHISYKNIVCVMYDMMHICIIYIIKKILYFLYIEVLCIQLYDIMHTIV